jgi:hypothetical protein
LQSLGGNDALYPAFQRHMSRYRFITPRRRGKWYASLREAQCYASAIGAGFLDPSGTFVPYRGTVLEIGD